MCRIAAHGWIGLRSRVISTGTLRGRNGNRVGCFFALELVLRFERILRSDGWSEREGAVGGIDSCINEATVFEYVGEFGLARVGALGGRALFGRRASLIGNRISQFFFGIYFR